MGVVQAVALRPELEPLPDRMKDLPVDRGYPVPWFVAWVDGPDGEKVPEFRATASGKISIAHRAGLCWVCGKKTGAYKCFVIGPMCGINRISSEPPSHHECAKWSARNCPFLSRPQMVRREDELTEALQGNVAGVMIPRNPGVALLWITKSYRLVSDDKGGVLFKIGDPERVEWYAKGGPATRAEVEHSVQTGLPLLQKIAAEEPGGLDEIARRLRELQGMYPVTGAVSPAHAS